MVTNITQPAAHLPDTTTAMGDHGRAAEIGADREQAVRPDPATPASPEQELLARTPCRVSKSYAPAIALVLSGAAEWVGTPPFEILVAMNGYRASAKLTNSGN